MRRRLRKKLRRKEFKELGFELVAKLQDELDERTYEQFSDELIAFIESLKLECGGGWPDPRNPSVDIFVSRYRSSATEADRAAVSGWFSTRSAIGAVFSVGDLTDAWAPVD